MHQDQTARLRRISGLLFIFVVSGWIPQARGQDQQRNRAEKAASLFSMSAAHAVDYSTIQVISQRASRADLDQEYLRSIDESRLRVTFLGNTLVHRAAEFGYLETELTRLLPEQAIVFRNLGWPGDTVSGEARIEFGPGEEDYSRWQRPDQSYGDYGFRKMLAQLRRERPHVLLIGYGSNVAFSAHEGLTKFQQGLEKLLDALEPTGVRIVLMSPPPREIRDGLVGNLRDQNRWLERVAKHLKDVAQQRHHDFVDLFRAWPRGAHREPHTENGIHLNARGYRHLAAIVAQQLTLPDQTWGMSLQSDGTVREVTGADLSQVRQTDYGLRWTVADSRLPTLAAGEPASRDRQLKIVGLQPGTFTLDIDGRRVARAAAEAWNRGVPIQRGPEWEQAEQLRQAIVKKNRLHFYGFRPQNKAYIHLFRRHERGHHEAEIERFALLVREAEAEIQRLRRPVRRIYELVRETDYPDDEVPGDAVVANTEEERQAFAIPDGFEMSLFAADPMIAKPININWDERGRMWVATSTIYPHLQPGQTPDDQILILEDIDRDGRADKRTVFADGLLVPHSVIPGHGGAFVTQSTDLLYLRDNDGDGRADERRVLLTGFGNADVHHMIHGLRWGPGGDLYFTQSIYINSVVETPWGVQTSNGSCVWRLRPETLHLEKFSQGLTNPWGHAFDNWGQSFATDGAGGSGIGYLFPGSAYSTHDYAGRALSSLNPGRPKECGLEWLSGRHLPSDWQQTLLTNDFRANRVTRYRLTESGSGYKSDFLGDMVTSSHRGFRPVDVKMGPDGAIYIVDWYNLIIDHGEVDFHHPLRDKRHGRIWRLSATDRPPVQPPDLVNASEMELLAALQLPEQWTRQQARRMLRERTVEAVVPALEQWVGDHSLSEHDALEALWVYQGLRVVNENLLRKLLSSPEHRVRAAAVRVLSDWRDRLGDVMERLERAVEDPHPQVRLEAVSALRAVGTRDAVEVGMGAINQPVDKWLDFALFRLAHELRNEWLPDLQAGKPMFGGDPDHVAFAVAAAGEAAALDPLTELISNNRIAGQQFVDTLTVLASLGDASERRLVFDRIKELDVTARNRVLTAMLQANRGSPPANSERLLELLSDRDSTTRILALRLAGRWRLVAARSAVRRRAASAQVADDERLAAADALVAIDTSEVAEATLREIYESSNDPQVRATAVAAWARASVESAATAAATELSAREDPQQAAMIVEAFLNQRNGPEQLAKAIQDRRLSANVAQLIIERVRISGKELPSLLRAVRTAADISPPASDLTSEDIASILRDVTAMGSVERGLLIFQRERLQCVTCHAVRGKGDTVGPDLSSLGGSARPGDILQSMLQPSASIKEGYQTSHVITTDGRVLTGILQQQTTTQIRIRDAQNNVHTISLDDIEEIEPSKVSIMPTGLTEILTRDELVDLVRYLSTLGVR